MAAAAYNLTFQLGFATTQICESVAVAVQTLLAREIASGGDDGDKNTKQTIMKAKRVRHLINGSILVGGLVAGGLSLLTFFQKEGVLRGLTTDASIREASRVIFPAVLITQGDICFVPHVLFDSFLLFLKKTNKHDAYTVLKGLAYPVNGIIMGGLDWKFTMLVRKVYCNSAFYVFQLYSTKYIR